MFGTILTSAQLTAAEIAICTAAAFLCGLIIALAYKAVSTPSKSFSMTVAILPETSDVLPRSVRIDPGLESGLSVVRKVPYRKAAYVVAVLEQLFAK